MNYIKSIILTMLLCGVVSINGCAHLPMPNIEAAHVIDQIYLGWYKFVDSETDETIPEYENRILKYLEKHPEISDDIANKMLQCIVILGMTEEQILVMYKPHRVLDEQNESKRIFQYSDRYIEGRISWILYDPDTEKKRKSCHIVTTWIALKNGIVTEIKYLEHK